MRKHLAWLVGAFALVLVLLVSTCSVSNLPFLSALPGQSRPAAPPSGWATGRTRGNPNARVTLVEYADFQ